MAQSTWWMELRVAWTERASCYAGLHASTAQQLFREPTQHFCRVLRLGEGRYIGWAGDVAAQAGTLEVHPDFGRQLNLRDQDVVTAAEESVQHAATVRTLGPAEVRSPRVEGGARLGVSESLTVVASPYEHCHRGAFPKSELAGR